jgi:hypothetical protein
MKILLVMVVFAGVIGCSKKKDPDLIFSGSENHFYQKEKKAFGGVEAIENSFVRVQGIIVAFFDPRATGEMQRMELTSGNARRVLADNARFSYVMEHDEALLNFVTIANDIYRMESFDHGQTWTAPEMIIKAEMVQWNPGVVQDRSGKWHMLVEADETGLPNQGGVACYYFTSLDGNSWTKHGKVIDHCGNPYMVATEEGILVIHGDSRGVWRTTASTFDGLKWRTHLDKFMIESPGVHVCDPHAIQANGKILLSVSVDQNSITLTEAFDSFESLYSRLLTK